MKCFSLLENKQIIPFYIYLYYLKLNSLNTANDNNNYYYNYAYFTQVHDLWGYFIRSKYKLSGMFVNFISN